VLATVPHLLAYPALTSSPPPGPVQCSSGYSCLPSWRWGGFGHAPSFNINLGLWDVLDKIIDPIGQVLFWIANFFWGILMLLAQVITSFDVVGTSTFGRDVNSAFASIGQALNSTGLIFGVAVVGVLAAGWRAARRGYHHGLRSLLRTLVPLGILIAMTEAAAAHPGAAAQPAAGTEITAAVGTPAWVIQKVQTEVDVAGSWLAQAISPANSNLAPDQADTRAPACVPYIEVLNQDGEAQLAASSNHAVASAAFLPETITYLWEQTYLPVWTSAQFGNSGLGDRVACHYLDIQAGVSPQQQAAVGVAAGYPGAVQWGPSSLGPGGAYGPLLNHSHYTQDIYAWSMCLWTGKGWTAATDYQNLDVGSGVLWSQVAPQVCNQWWTEGAGIYNQHWDGSTNAGLPSCSWFGTCNPFALTTSPKIQGAVYGSPAATASPQAAQWSRDAFDFMTDFEGHNAGGMLLGGVVVTLVSLALVWAMAGLCLGVAIAGLALFLIAMLLPLLLLALALTTEHSMLAKRSFKIGLSMMAAKGITMVLLGALVLFINVISKIWAVPPGAGSIGTAFLQLLPAVAGLAILATLAKRTLGISLMNPLSSSRLGFAMAKEADRGWGGAAGALSQRLAGHSNPLVRAAFGGGAAALAGGALGALETRHLLARRQQMLQRAGGASGPGTEQDPVTRVGNIKAQQRAGKRRRGLGTAPDLPPPVPGEKARGKAAAGATAPQGGASKITWGQRWAALQDRLSARSPQELVRRLPDWFAGRVDRLRERHGRFGGAVRLLGMGAAASAALTLGPAAAVLAGLGGYRLAGRLADPASRMGRHVKQLHHQALQHLDRWLGLHPGTPADVPSAQLQQARQEPPEGEGPPPAPSPEEEGPTGPPDPAPPAADPGARDEALQDLIGQPQAAQDLQQRTALNTQWFLERQQGTFDEHGNWVRTVPNQPPPRTTRPPSSARLGQRQQQHATPATRRLAPRSAPGPRGAPATETPARAIPRSLPQAHPEARGGVPGNGQPPGNTPPPNGLPPGGSSSPAGGAR